MRKLYLMMGILGIVQSVLFVATCPAHLAWVSIITTPLYAWIVGGEIGELWKRS